MSSISSAATAEGDSSMKTDDELRGQRARRNLRNLRDEVRQDETLKTDARKLSEKLIQMDQHLEDVKDAASGLQDARLFHDLAGLCRGQVEAINCNKKKFSTTEYVAHLAERMNATVENDILMGSREKWIAYGRQCQVYFKRVPTLNYLFGSLPLGDEECKEVRRKKAIVTSHQKPQREAPTVVSKRSAARKDEDNVEYLVRRIHSEFRRVCRERRTDRIGFFDFVLDPVSFGQSVENMFHVSFLVKERKVCLVEEGESGLPELVSLDDEDGGDGGGLGDEPSDQMIMTINMDQWRRMVETLGITKPMIHLMPEETERKSDLVPNKKTKTTK